jgi:hypothetical protein
VKETAALALSDRAWWPQVRREWKNNRHGTASWTVASTEPAAKAGGLGSIVSRSCGHALVPLSQLVVVKPVGATNCVACQSHLFFVDRRGRALLYYIY